MKDLSISKYVLLFLVLTLMGYLYDKYKSKTEKIIHQEEYDLIRKYLLNGDALTHTKPIVWVYIDYEPNSRHWENFGSRLTTQLNQPYKIITIQSIIKQTQGIFNVCLIDDHSFSKLLPQWTINISKLADPVKTHIRSLALCKLLYHYGGISIPASYLALQPIDNLYKTIVDTDKCIIMETKNAYSRLSHSSSSLSSSLHTSTSASAPASSMPAAVSMYKDTTMPNHLFMGCNRNNQTINNLIQYIEYLVSNDLTNEQDFYGLINRKCNEYIKDGNMILIDGKLIGTKSNDNKVIEIDQLLETSDGISFSPHLQGILIPDQDILKRTKYAWFARMSQSQIFTENSVLCKYLLLSTYSNTYV